MIGIRPVRLQVVFIILFTSVLYVSAQDHDHDHDHGHAYEGAAAYYLAEHGDFEIGLEEGELELHIHCHAGAIVDGNALEEDTGFAPEQITVVATEEAETRRPAGDLWEATGVDVNEALWVLPQHEREGLPAFGFSTEEIEPGLLVDDQVLLSLRALQGPGDFSLWEDDAFGQPGFFFSTHEGLTSSTFPIGLHAHFNWAFSAPGDYILVFEATAALVTGGSVEALAIHHFKVTEAPLCLQPLAGDVNGDCIVDEHDLHIVEDNQGKTVPSWPGDPVHLREGHEHD